MGQSPSGSELRNPSSHSLSFLSAQQSHPSLPNLFEKLRRTSRVSRKNTSAVSLKNPFRLRNPHRAIHGRNNSSRLPPTSLALKGCSVPRSERHGRSRTVFK